MEEDKERMLRNIGDSRLMMINKGGKCCYKLGAGDKVTRSRIKLIRKMLQACSPVVIVFGMCTLKLPKQVKWHQWITIVASESRELWTLIRLVEGRQNKTELTSTILKAKTELWFEGLLIYIVQKAVSCS